MRFLIKLFILICLSLPTYAQQETVLSLSEWMSKDDDFKLGIIAGVIHYAKQDGITLSLHPSYYLNALEELYANSVANGDEEGLDQSFAISFRTIAVMDCDWNNGSDYLQFAQQYMGPQLFEAFKQLYPDKYKKLEAGCQ